MRFAYSMKIDVCKAAKLPSESGYIDENTSVPVNSELFNFATASATFKVKLHEIKKKELPELDDEFAKDVSEFDTLKELKASIKEKLEEENKNKAHYETEEKVMLKK